MALSSEKNKKIVIEEESSNDLVDQKMKDLLSWLYTLLDCGKNELIEICKNTEIEITGKESVTKLIKLIVRNAYDDEN